ncbi:MAG TPA: response regulator [Chloroflexota bacterium]|nr:response regulator [Chloroflexota bacterium]
MVEPGCKSILVIDDDHDLLTLVAFLLEGEGYRVLTASDGREGLARLEEEMPDLILLDMKMPVMNGWEFAREYHATYEVRAPVVVLTAAEDARKRAMEVGAAAWLGKPFDLDALVAMVAKHA